MLTNAQVTGRTLFCTLFVLHDSVSSFTTLPFLPPTRYKTPVCVCVCVCLCVVLSSLSDLIDWINAYGLHAYDRCSLNQIGIEQNLNAVMSGKVSGVKYSAFCECVLY